MRRTTILYISIFICCSIILGIGGLHVPLVAHAESIDELNATVTSLSAKIQALDKEIANFNKQISATQGQAKTLKVALAALELQRKALITEISRTQLKIKETESSIADTKVKIGATEDKISQNQHALAKTLRTIVYQEQGTPIIMQALTIDASFSSLVHGINQSVDFSNAVRGKVSDLSAAKDQLSTEKAVFEIHKDQLEKLNASLSDKKALVDQTSQQKNMLLVQTKNKESEYQKLVADRQKKKSALEAEMLDVESRIKAVADVSKLPRYGKGVLHYPVVPVIITQYFGNTPFATQNPQVYNGAGHNGVDFGAQIGTPVMAAADGIVTGTGNTDAACPGVSYGKWILIRHNNGLSTLYAHMSVIQVQSGQAVTTGQKIGLSGNTGYSTGPHVHFTVYASDVVHVSGPTEYRSKVCGTYLIMPLAPRSGYLNPLSYL